jgi:hypothetical protein
MANARSSAFLLRRGGVVALVLRAVNEAELIG